jgi:hypothetical protein
MFALATGSFGLLAIGLLVMSIAPDRRDGPIAISATTTADIDTTLRSSGVAAIGRFASDGSGSDDWSVRMEPALATPIGDGRSALATLQGVRRTEGAIDVRLSSGSVVSAAVMDHTDDGLVVVTIAASDAAHTVGDGPPDDDEIVTVLTEPPITVPFHEVDDLELAEGTPVLDSEGHLIGLCTRAGGQRAVLDVTGHPDDDRAGSTTTEPEPSTPGHHRGGGVVGPGTRRRLGHRHRSGHERGRRRHQRRAAVAVTATAAAITATIAPSAISWRRFGVIMVHHFASVPST